MLFTAHGDRSCRTLASAVALTVLPALAASVAFPTEAVAQVREERSREERDRQARSEFLAGREAFTRGDYDEAARRFEQAYELSRRPQLLFNLGATYERQHRWTHARDAFGRFLREVPESSSHGEVRARLAVIDREIEAEERRANQPRPDPVVVIRPGRDRVIVRTVTAPSPISALRVVGFAAGGLAVVSTVTSVTLGLFTNSYYEGLANDCGQRTEGCPQAVIDDVALRAVMINAFWIGAVALGATATALFVVDAARPSPPPVTTVVRSHRGAPRATVSPWIAPLGSQGAVGGLTFVTGAL